jgi:hypothetical protein
MWRQIYLSPSPSPHPSPTGSGTAAAISNRIQRQRQRQGQQQSTATGSSGRSSDRNQGRRQPAVDSGRNQRPGQRQRSAPRCQRIRSLNTRVAPSDFEVARPSTRFPRGATVNIVCPNHPINLKQGGSNNVQNGTSSERGPTFSEPRLHQSRGRVGGTSERLTLLRCGLGEGGWEFRIPNS